MYPIMGMAANVALVACGIFVKAVCKATAGGGTHAMLCALVAAVTVGTGLMALTKSFVDR